jgi:LCP family protein required for cell wall assembly
MVVRTPDRAARTRPAPPPPPVRPLGERVLRRVRITAAVSSVLVLAVTGTAWGLYRDVTAGITTTDVISGGDDGQDVLLVGVDSRTDARGEPLPPEVLRELSSGPDTGVLNSDTIILLHVPSDGGAAVAFSIPRDTYVDVPGLRRDKINAAYPAVAALTAQRLVDDGLPRAQVRAESARAGRAALIGAVEDLTGVSVDHYAEVNLLGFHDLTRAIGGVDVCLTRAVDEPLSGARLPAGPQTVSGRDALAFVRQRQGLPDGDLSRIRRQQVFLAAVADRVLSAGTLTDPAALSGLVDVVQRSVVISEGWDLLAFARRAADLAAGDLQFVTIPTIGRESNDRGDVLLVDPPAVAEFVEQRIAAQRAAAEAAAETAEAARAAGPPPVIEVIAARYVVDVRNGSEAAGLASDVAAHLRALGFVGGAIGNTGPVERSTVRYSGPDGEAARDVAEQLGGLAVAGDDAVVRGHLEVVLGADFDPGVLPAPAPEVDPGAPPPPVDAPITADGVPCID